MKGFRTRISRKDSSTPPPGSPTTTKKSSPLAPAPAPARSASGDSFRLPRGSADSTATSSARPQRTASRSSTASTSSLSAAVRRAGSSSRIDALSSSTRDPGPRQQARAPPPAAGADQPPLKEEPTDPVLPAATPKDATPKESTPEPTVAVKPDSPPTPPSSPPPPPTATPPIPRPMSPPLTIETNGVPRRGSGSETEQVKPDEESFELLATSESQAPAEAPSMQMPQPDTTERAGERFLATNPFLDQPETPIDGPRLVAPMPTRANGKSVSFSQTVQEISPLTDYAPSALPSPAEDVKSDHSYSSSATGLNATGANSSGFNWTEHVLPDTTYYYTLPAHLSPTQTGVVTDMDLRTPARLRVVEAYLRTIPPVLQQPPVDSSHAPPMPEPSTPTSSSTTSWRGLVSPTHMPMPAAQPKRETVEVYLRNVATRARQGQGEFVPLTTYVRHGARAVSMAPPYETREGLTDADRLDQEAQYWSFLEAHPAHAPLPDGARDEALEALTWSYTERVIQSRTAARVGNAFSERECHELLSLLRGLDGPKASSAIHTRIVAKVHLRLAQWRQQFVALGESGGYPPSPSGQQQQQQQKASFDIIEPRVRVPFRRSCARLVFGVLCLGIPYLFFARQSRSGEDEEADAPAARTTSLVLSAAVCLVGAVMLSVSVTFLALPGLENLARGLALVSVCCSLASLGASVLVVPRRPGSPVTFTRARALPVVLLAYAVASFVGATVAYAAKGVVARDPRVALERFGAQTLWLVLGVWAVLALVLGAAAWALRERRPAQARGGYRALPS